MQKRCIGKGIGKGLTEEGPKKTSQKKKGGEEGPRRWTRELKEKKRTVGMRNLGTLSTPPGQDLHQMEKQTIKRRKICLLSRGGGLLKGGQPRKPGV